MSYSTLKTLTRDSDRYTFKIKPKISIREYIDAYAYTKNVKPAKKCLNVINDTTNRHLCIRRESLNNCRDKCKY